MRCPVTATLRILVVVVSFTVDATTESGEINGEPSNLEWKLLSNDKANDKEGQPQQLVDHGKEFMDWMKREDGAFFHPNLTIRRTGPNETSPYFGMFATGNIKANELLLEIPRSMVLHPDPLQVGDRASDDDEEGASGVVKAVDVEGTTYDILYDDGEFVEGVLAEFVYQEGYSSSLCATPHKLIREMKLGDKSRYAPYVNYLLSQPSGQLPTSWSKAGQALLAEVLGFDEENQQILPPWEPFGWIEDDWYIGCKGGKSPLEELAYMLVIQRGWDEVLIPVFDMMSHRNGPWLNTDHEPIRNGASVKVRAARDIRAGEEIFTSYNFCTDCQGRVRNYGTPELLRDYGFVEDYPQRWVFLEQHVSFDLLEVFDDQGVPTGALEVKWIRAPPSISGIHFMTEQLQRLQELAETHLETRDPAIPDHEWFVITRFTNATMTAFRYALELVAPMDEKCGDQDGTCDVLSNRYNRLEVEVEEWGDERPITCNSEKIYAWDDWEKLESIQSPYQELLYSTVPNWNNDMCFELDTVIQICASYRPHYHEMMVHFPARFINTVKRILFVGGGDSMLLHEALKYPTLELVVGLELDQVVTRNSFKYFGTQPHWDDERVEWWFGDATKSLTMLPIEYFGSFDLVLVDLSETVQALSVTDELDVLGALALLVKPDGIFVQNEYMHFLEQASIFKHSLHIHYYGVPIVCSQSLILASNGVDFIHGPVKDHGVDLLVDLLDKESVRYNIIRDYQRNHTNPRHCDKAASTETKLATQVRSPGILMIVEAEDTTDLGAPETVRDNLIGALQKHNLKTLSTAVAPLSENRYVITIVLEDGYVVARVWPDQKYCAFDIHFWSRFDEQDAVRKSLVKAVGSSSSGSSSSSYRIIAGGMFGVERWRDDENTKGPKLSLLCQLSEAPKDDKARKPWEPDALNALLRESMKLVGEKDYVLAVLCGHDKCTSSQSLENSTSVGALLPIPACSGLSDDVTFAEDGRDRMFACEKDITKLLQRSLVNKKIRAIVLDHTAPIALAQIVTRIFNSPFYASKWLADDLLVESVALDGASWRKAFVDFFRLEIYQQEPVFTSEVSFLSSDQTLDFVVTSSGDEYFPGKLLLLAEEVEAQTGLEPEIQKIRAGLFSFQHDFETDQAFSHRDYDQSFALKQWFDQQPLGLQTVFQLEGTPMSRLSAKVIEEALRRSLTAVDSDVKIDASDIGTSVIGEGCVFVANWPDGNVVVTWDGRNHIDLNLFTCGGGEEFADAFEKAFLGKNVAHLETVLRDTQPRGTGRVVTFPKPEDDPLWKADGKVIRRV